VIEELGAIGEPVVQDLIYALDKWYEWSQSDASSLSLRISIARVLGIIGDERAIKPIIKMAGRIEKTVEHREVAAESLALIGKSVIQPMLELLESDAADAQQLSAWTLGKIGDPIAIKYLIPMLSKQPFHYPHVRAAANRALVELTKQDFGEDIELWNNWVMNNAGDSSNNTT
jgi:hemoglobin-like flavoprotein